MEPVKKYNWDEIVIRMNNLREKFGSYNVDTEIRLCCKYTDNKCDAYNLAYRKLKDKYTKIKRHRYGYVRTIDYEIKQRKPKLYIPYTIYDNVYSNVYSSSSSWTITTNSLGSYGIF